jgi:curved DNA-binding protein CbpA
MLCEKMAPSPITEDYYAVLEVDQTATPELIIKSYRRLALKAYPDRHAHGGSTQSFQLVRRTYEAWCRCR